jgi:ribose 5-phosphate isomerase B
MYAIGSDHGGFALKQEIMKHLKNRGLEFKDYGTYTEDSCDYPVYGEAVARAVVAGECERGILVCGTGIGISIAANKVRGVRAAVCADCFSAEMAKCHNDANIISLGARVVGTGLALKIIDSFIDAEFEGGRHGTRVEMLNSIEG